MFHSFLNEVYNLNEDGNYSINFDLQKDREKVLKMRKIMNDMNFPGVINLTLMEKMFDRFKMHYNKQFANSLILLLIEPYPVYIHSHGIGKGFYFTYPTAS